MLIFTGDFIPIASVNYFLAALERCFPPERFGALLDFAPLPLITLLEALDKIFSDRFVTFLPFVLAFDWRNRLPLEPMLVLMLPEDS